MATPLQTTFDTGNMWNKACRFLVVNGEKKRPAEAGLNYLILLAYAPGEAYIDSGSETPNE